MIVVDVETTGLVPGRHGIVSIGAVDLTNATNQFYVECCIADNIEIDPGALRVNGFTETEVRDDSKATAVEAVARFIEWSEPIKERTLGGHNTHFDVAMLQAVVHPSRLRWPFGFRALDLHSMAYLQMKRLNHPLPLYQGLSDIKANTVLRYVGLPLEPTPHIALMGAKMEAEAFSRLLTGQVLLDEFSKYAVPDYLRGYKATPTLF
ncbi:MAG: 3'-5' exonuclease [Candidatus Saccharimonadales bacterium]